MLYEVVKQSFWIGSSLDLSQSEVVGETYLSESEAVGVAYNLAECECIRLNGGVVEGAFSCSTREDRYNVAVISNPHGSSSIVTGYSIRQVGS